MTRGGYFQGELSQRVGLNNQIYKKLFAKVKFITNEHQMEVGGQIANIVMRDLNVPENKKVVFWLTQGICYKDAQSKTEQYMHDAKRLVHE
jgi:hypothetical protein